MPPVYRIDDNNSLIFTLMPHLAKHLRLLYHDGEISRMIGTTRPDRSPVNERLAHLTGLSSSPPSLPVPHSPSPSTLPAPPLRGRTSSATGELPETLPPPKGDDLCMEPCEDHSGCHGILTPHGHFLPCGLPEGHSKDILHQCGLCITAKPASVSHGYCSLTRTIKTVLSLKSGQKH